MKRNTTALVIVIVICVLGFMPFEAQSTEIWSDDFEDGNYDGWTLDGNMGGGFSAADGSLNCTTEGTGDISGYLSAGIWHPSTVSTGTWEFDVMAQLDSLIQFTFLYNVSLGYGDPAQGYNFWMEVQANGDTMFKLLRAESSAYEVSLDLYAPETPDASNTYHIEITRHSDGQFYIWIDDELVMEKQDATYSISTDIIFTGSHYCAIDNIVVSDDVRTPTPTTTTPTDTPTTSPTSPTTTGQPFDMTLVYIAIGGAAVIIIVLVVILRRR